MSTPGARSAVLPAPVRRALLLAALLSGILVAAWTAASDPVRAEEDPAVTTVVQQSGAVAGAEQIRTARAASDQVDTGRNALVAPNRVGGPLSSAAMAVGEDTVQTVFDTSAVITSGALAGGRDVAQQVRSAVHVVAEPVEEHLSPGIPTTAPDRQEGPATGSAANEDTRGEETTTARVDSAAAVAPALHPDSGTAEQHFAGPVVEGTSGVGTDGAAARSTLSTSTATAAVPSSAAGGTAVAGYLPTAVASASTPGRLQAARHVLRSVPAGSADEPTFSPD